MISKQLLSEVLSCEILSFYLDEVTLLYTYNKIKCIDENYQDEINIYELANKCKEWAFKKDKYKWLFSYKSFTKCHCDIVDNQNRKFIFISFAGDNEPEAVFKACEWVLKSSSID